MSAQVLGNGLSPIRGGTEQAAPDCYLSCRDQLLVSA